LPTTAHSAYSQQPDEMQLVTCLFGRISAWKREYKEPSERKVSTIYRRGP
jgi:hypothetical protein